MSGDGTYSDCSRNDGETLEVWLVEVTKDVGGIEFQFFKTEIQGSNGLEPVGLGMEQSGSMARTAGRYERCCTGAENQEYGGHESHHRIRIGL